MCLPAHGSNPQYLFNALHLAKPNHVIDFSVNVNPYGMPRLIEKQWSQFLTYVRDYPDPHSFALKEAVAQKESIEKDNILIGNGAAELVFLLANRFREQDVLIIDPTFSEYHTACTAHGCRVHSVVLKEDNDWQISLDDIVPQLEGKVALFLCSPNNPTGVRYDKDILLSLIKAAFKQKVIVVIDEAFYDFCLDPYTLVPYVQTYPNLVILRSFTKMFAIAGIRLGWIAADPTFISELSTFQPHWSVNAIAEQVGLLCIHEDAFVKQTSEQVARERKRVVSELKQLDFVISNSETNYYILRETKKQSMKPLLRFLLNEGLTARHTENFAGLDGNYLRFAIRTKAENDRLITVLKRWRQQCSFL
ncbi:threonine-phosphate decarboxylase CobD [Pueribacillus sp. YX66]|uniref:threonine-phosphate decarboxylase CobD n=1 Tax=Pueribacillus sp. YX66 TaxID=3229242 RepID=UPI00358D8D62